MIRCGLPRRRGRRGGPRAPRRTRGPGPRSASTSLNRRARHLTREIVTGHLPVRLPAAATAKEPEPSPCRMPGDSRATFLAGLRGDAARRGWLAPPIGGGKGGSRVLLGVPVGLGRPANGVIPPFFNRVVRGRGVKDMRRPPFRAAGTITMNRDTSPAKESRGRLRAVPGPIGTGLTSPPSRRPPRRRPGPAGATLTRRGAGARRGRRR